MIYVNNFTIKPESLAKGQTLSSMNMTEKQTQSHRKEDTKVSSIKDSLNKRFRIIGHPETK